MLVRALPRVIIRRTKALHVIRCAGECEHRHWLTNPNPLLAKVLLEVMHLCAIVMFGQDQIRLHPRHALPRMDEKFSNTFGRDTAILVQFVAAFVGNALDSTFHRDAMRIPEQVETLFIPEINSRLQANGDFPRTEFLQKLAHRPAHAEDFVNPIDVVDTTCNQRVYFLQNRADIAFAKLVAEQCLVAEAARPRTAACEFQFRASSRALENMVPMLVTLDVVVIELESTQLLHIGDAECWAQMHTRVIAPAAAFDLRPG